jgi:hypothetical protein
VFNPGQGGNGAQKTECRGGKVRYVADRLRLDPGGERAPDMAVNRALACGADGERQLDLMNGRAGERAGLGTGLAKFLVGFP